MIGRSGEKHREALFGASWKFKASKPIDFG
jgi:hypothetical protein